MPIDHPRVRSLARVACLAAALAALPLTSAAEEPSHEASSHAEPSDLGLLGLFTEGWDQPWVHRQRATRDMALLRVTTNFLEQELRLDSVRTDLLHNARSSRTDFANALIAYAVNRRLMLELISNYQWNAAGGSAAVNGSGGAALVRLQLVETRTASYSVQVRVSAPNRPIGQTQTTIGYFLSGWQDVQSWIPALGRVGLYYSVEYDNLQGPRAKGAAQNTLAGALSLARTWTDATTPVVGDLTTFLELYESRPLDGASSGKDVLSLTPGVRFWFRPKNSLTLGADLPVSHLPTYSVAYRATYILNF